MKHFFLSLAALLSLVGCQSHSWPDVWRSITTPKGVAWHNPAHQQTAFDVDSNGRVDRLRFWIGSGLAEELIDEDLDGWFDIHLSIVYGNERERKKVHAPTPSVPVTDGSGAFPRPFEMKLNQ
jgi:hypothetical protein